MKTLLKTVLITAALAVSCSATALEPLQDRAQVKHINSTLLMPDGSDMNVDMSFDCGSEFKSTGIIVTTEQGAKFLANAYSKLYGSVAGEKVKQAWLTKANPDDPRKPTMLLINDFGSLDWTVNSTKVTELKHFSSTQSVNESYTGPNVLQLCGTRSHHPTELQ
ncbi:hypothetical protein H5187_20855 [Pseudoalteromonas sp. SG44-1]|uniref:hypothetical protein n=1 Tax=Pseudoalteromonas sp. SG44-1 TaxID=2760964 RepID=UPI0015FF2968|nr:hypothetical protein [Pseudoalteromonas sp. SG44-1]MBB1419695.1 hypothetical protein [Pseudoalteromonas sp. SG44-1]